MDSYKIREQFLNFFREKQHSIVPSAPMVVRDDPSLMFTNAGMNQFKDVFLENREAPAPRVADTQKCLRVSGKHNDLEEVGHDTYHHTMFEMLGNWSFGDYFKKEAIEWAWELLTEVYGIPGDNLYVTVFGGDEKDGLEADSEAYGYWNNIVSKDKILYGSKKDNFWEMGDTGPCGPCSEIHIDIRSEEEKKQTPGKELVNQDHPEVIEVWNLVFIEFNRMANGSLQPLPKKHIDTGMGFERLTMILQDKRSNYDTDIFQPLIEKVGRISGKNYNDSRDIATAMRVVSDHARAVTFAIGDGQLPSNVKAGYVIRRILRRAIRYGYTFLELKEPFLHKLVPVLVQQMGDVFPEIVKQQSLIEKVINEEEQTFLRTLETGIQMLDKVIGKKKKEETDKRVSGKIAFELYDTYGFPLDLTELILKENGLVVDKKEFDEEMAKQKARSRQAATMETGDWVILKSQDTTRFVGYDLQEAPVEVIRYRKIKIKGKEQYQLVFDQTPFYSESGGQIGDTGYIEDEEGNKYDVVDTRKENNLTVHFLKKFPENIEGRFKAVVSSRIRTLTANNHSATHLMHHALRHVLGEHVEQKGSLVRHDYLRFDFSHFQRMAPEQIREVENIVNRMIRQNLPREEHRSIAMKDAENMGAIALFGEKYGENVRVIKFGDSVELCGGTHVEATGQIGIFKITAETAIAAGIRRIEAVTADEAEKYINQNLDQLAEIKSLFKNSKNIVKSVSSTLEENKKLEKEVEKLTREKALNLKNQLKESIEEINGINFLSTHLKMDMATVKDLAFAMKNEINNLFFVIGSEDQGKANLTLIISQELVREHDLNAGEIIHNLAKEIKGGGGGQPHFASAGGKDPNGLDKALGKAKEWIKEKV
ncbi:MAG: alanine--tRNA ligase [Bacteroidales bacterium]|nr:alanine--tRNA ligase [Bacteroidales bacterium]